MKTRLYVKACAIISFSIFSCSTDDVDLKTESTANNLKNEIPIYVNKNLSAKIKDTIILSINSNTFSTTEGDPGTPRPTRKD